MTTGIRAFFAGAIALSVLSAMPRCARAAFVDTQISAFADGQTSEHVLGLATASDKSQKTAALIIRGPDPSKDEYKPRAAFFSDPHQWDQLVALWNKARLTRPPKRTNINGDSVKVGSYFDGTSAALLQMSVNDNATIEFDLVDKDKRPILFELRPKDFEEFDRAVKAVSAYFGK
jgi:hypothetical protein